MFRCKDLLTLPSLAKAKVISGRSGFDNRIRWVYKPENMHFSKWVKGMELIIISTPVIQSPDFDLGRLIEKAVELNMSGAILLVGEHYIETISQKTRIYTDEHRFPLFIISGEIPLIDIFEEIGHAIAYGDARENFSNDVLSSIIFDNEINEDILKLKCDDLGYDISLPQQICLFRVTQNVHSKLDNCDNIMERLHGLFEEAQMDIMLSHYGNNMVGLFSETQENTERLEKVFYSFNDYIKENYSGWKACLGIGLAYDRLKGLQNSFREASRCITLSDKLSNQAEIMYYKDMGFFNLLFELEDTKAVEVFVNNTLGAIIKYDEDNSTELLDTLKVYLENNCSILHASEKLFTHRNTVKYRIQRVEEITGKNLENSLVRLEFMNAIYCKEICRF